MRMLVRNLAAAEAGVQEGEEEHQTPPQRQLGPLGAGRASVRLFPSRAHTAAASSRHRRQPRVMQRGLDIGMGA